MTKEYTAPELPTELDSWKIEERYENGLRLHIIWFRRHSNTGAGGYNVATSDVVPSNYINGFEQAFRAGKRRLKEDERFREKDATDKANAAAAKKAAGL